MAAKNERAPIELFAAAAPEAPDPTVSARFDEATLRLARLIGRQMAREVKRRTEELTLKSGNSRHDKRQKLT